MKKALVTDGVHPLLLKGLENLGYHVDYHPKISLEEVRSRIAPYEGLIINSKIIVDKSFLDKAPRLKFIGRLGSGMEIIDQVYAKEKCVAVFSAPEGNCNAVAEHALGMLLALANNFLNADAEVRQKIWERERNRGFEIMGRTIGIIGFGHTGNAFAQKLAGMGVQVLAYDKYKERYATGMRYVKETDLNTVLKQSDIISLHLPLTAETYHYVDAGFIKKTKEGLILINTSRGTCIDTEVLLNALISKKVGGACLDVFENEKPATFNSKEKEIFEQLYDQKNVILSPHVAGWTHESKARLAQVLLDKISVHFS